MNKMKVLLVSMEAGLRSDVPTYAGGLGVLVGDKLRAARDMKQQVDAVTFSYPLGYARHIVVDGKVAMETVQYDPHSFFKSAGEMRLKTRFGRLNVEVLRGENAWLIHTDLAKKLYIEASPEERLKKEVILGTAAARLAEEYDVLHAEESHTAFATELVRKQHPKKRVVFTTHTPLPHGHEVWSARAIRRFWGGVRKVSMTKLALRNADYVNCVSRMQWETMNPHLDYRADYITNGVHVSWLHPAIRRLLRKHVGDVTRNPLKFALARALPAGEFKDARAKAREELVKEVNGKAWKNREFGDAFTVGIARRFTGYKRLDLVLHHWEELDKLAAKQPLQLVFAGVAHPLDTEGLATIEKVIAIGGRAKNLRIAYFPFYTMELARKMIAGSDLWLNVPREGLEASGTSWMKAMLNGTVLVSTLSGSVPEYADETNALIIPRGSEEEQARTLLGHIKAAMKDRKLWKTGVKAIASSAPLTAHRMMHDYFRKAYS